MNMKRNHYYGMYSRGRVSVCALSFPFGNRNR